MSSNEWYTPARYVDAARSVMGGIDLDPASCAVANETVKATRYYTEQENGLEHPWFGRVWLNPPYSSPASPAGISGAKRKGQTGLFITKLIEAYEKGEVTEAIVCVNADTVRSWFQVLWSQAICFASPAVAFIRPDRTSEHHFFGTAFAYFGHHEDAFIEIFSQFGYIAKIVQVVAR